MLQLAGQAFEGDQQDTRPVPAEHEPGLEEAALFGLVQGGEFPEITKHGLDSAVWSAWSARVALGCSCWAGCEL